MHNASTAFYQSISRTSIRAKIFNWSCHKHTHTKLVLENANVGPQKERERQKKIHECEKAHCVKV